MKTPHDRLKRHFGALVEYSEHLEDHRPDSIPSPWWSALYRRDYDPSRIAYVFIPDIFLLLAPTDTQRVEYTLALGQDLFAHNDLPETHKLYPWGEVLAQANGFMHYGRETLIAPGVAPMIEGKVFAFIRFWAFNDELASILDALPVRAHGPYRRREPRKHGFEHVDWGDTLSAMRRAA